MVQETRYSLLSEIVSLVQQRLDDYASVMEMISRRLEALDNNFRGLQAMFEKRLPIVQQREGPQKGHAPQLENHPQAEVPPPHPHPGPEVGALIPKPIRLQIVSIEVADRSKASKVPLEVLSLLEEYVVVFEGS